MRRQGRGPWYLLTGLVLGLAFGLVYAWVLAPVKYVDTSPVSMRQDFKDQFRALIAVAYLSSGNLERARVRLSLIDGENPVQAVAAQAQRAVTEGRPESEIQALGLLANALSGGQVAPVTPAVGTPTITALPGLTETPTPLIQQSSTPAESTPSPEVTEQHLRGTPTFTATALPTRTPTLTPGAEFVIRDREMVCDLSAGEALIQVEVLDAAEQPVPGVAVVVRWEGGEDYFITGLKPEFSLGYADFEMTPGVAYSLQLVSGGEAETDLTAVECEGQVGRFWGNWRLTFIQP